MRYKQTGKMFSRQVNKSGCLVFSLLDIAEEYTGRKFTPLMINDLLTELMDLGFINKDCFVKDHTKLLQQALEMLGNHDKVTYAGAKYLNGKKSWGDGYGMYFIVQLKTKHGHSHFRRMHYDSYLPEIEFTNVISIRYYNIGV